MKHLLSTYSMLMIALLLSILCGNSVFSKEDLATDQINKKLQSTSNDGDVDDYRATLAEVLVTKNEAQAMNQLNKLLSKYKNSPIEPSLLFRKAELYVRQGKSARFFEYNRASDKMLTLIPKAVKQGTSTNKLESAVSIYEQIEKRFPHYSDLDLVLFNNAFLRQQLKQEKYAETLYRRLLAKFPESYLVPDTHLAIGEMLYQQRRYADALKDYNKIKNFPLARVYVYGLYKTGWTKYQLRDVEGAIGELETVIDVSNKSEKVASSKVNLKDEALNDLVLFYPEAREAKNAFKYFRKLAGDNVGNYILMLSQLYERHSKHSEQETVLFDLVDNFPKSIHAPLAWKAIIDTDINVKNFEKATKHLVTFESHCKSYFKDQFTKDEIHITVNDEEVKSCPSILTSQSLKISQKWHNEWKKKKAQLDKGNFAKKDKVYVETIADATEVAYEVYLRNSKDENKINTARFNYSELLYQRKKYRPASKEYFIVAKSIKDTKLKHDASYYSIISLEAAAGDKWSDSDEERYIELADFYIKNTKENKYTKDIKFKRAFIAYEKGRYDESLPIFKQLGWKGNDKIAVKSQDLYLDILNIKKKYKELIEAADHLRTMTSEKDRKASLEKIYRESFFSYTVELEKNGKYEEAENNFYKFAKENEDSPLADKAFWNYTQLLIKANKLSLASDKLLELYKKFPKSTYAKKAILKSFELNEFVGDTKNAAYCAQELSKIELSKSTEWKKLAADFLILSFEFDKGIALYKDLLKLPDAKLRESITEKLLSIKVSNSHNSKELDSLLSKYSKNDELYVTKLNEAKKLFDLKKYSDAFKVSSSIVGESNISKIIQAEARFIQAEILRKEFESQSVKSKIERIELVLSMKTEKLDKAQRAYQSAIKYGSADVTIKSFLSLAKMYEHYVQALKNIEITDEITKKDRELLTSEIEKIIMPIEEKIAETLQQGVDFALKYPTYTGISYELKNELNRVNFKGYKYVNYSVAEPSIALPTSW